MPKQYTAYIGNRDEPMRVRQGAKAEKIIMYQNIASTLDNPLFYK
jgi:hypothetical protein